MCYIGQHWSKLSKTDVIVGLKKLNQRQSLAILELLEDRYNVRSTIVASQIPTDKFYATIKDPTIADAIVDRLLNNSYRTDLNTEDSMRGMKESLIEETGNNQDNRVTALKLETREIKVESLRRNQW